MQSSAALEILKDSEIGETQIAPGWVNWVNHSKSPPLVDSASAVDLSYSITNLAILRCKPLRFHSTWGRSYAFRDSASLLLIATSVSITWPKHFSRKAKVELRLLFGMLMGHWVTKSRCEISSEDKISCMSNNECNNSQTKLFQIAQKVIWTLHRKAYLQSTLHRLKPDTSPWR